MKHVVFFLFLFIPLLAQAQDPRYEKFMASGDRELRAGNYPLAGKKYTAALEFAFSPDERTAAREGVKKAEQLRVRQVERERDRARRLASQADTLRWYLQGDSTYEVYLRSGIAKFRKGNWEEAQYDLAIARFTRETPEVIQWLRLLPDVHTARRLALAGQLDRALAMIKSVIDRDTICNSCRELQKHIQKSQSRWDETLAGRELDRIDSLNVSGLYFLPDEIDLLTSNLRILYLSYSNLSQLPPKRWKSISNLINLQSLNLSGNDLLQLPSEIGQLTNLQSLDLTGNDLLQLPPEIGQLTNLQSLDLSYVRLSKLPPELSNLTHLQSLDLGASGFNNLPPESWKIIGQLISLQSLNLSSDSLNSYIYSQLPPEGWKIIGQLTNLRSLNLSDNDIFQLPSEIGQLTNLQSLNLSDNDIFQLPSEIGQLTNLQSLNLSDNGLFKLQPESWKIIGQLTNLRSLNLDHNDLTLLPPDIGELVNLQSLDLSGNDLLQLPPEIGQLTNLQSLGLSDNNSHFKLQPESWKIIGQLTNLRSLNLDSNYLTLLPPDIGELVNLQSLDLKYNSLSQLPQESWLFLKELINLKDLRLDGNFINADTQTYIRSLVPAECIVDFE